MCIIMHLALRLVAFRLAFSTILPGVLLHLALRFAAKRRAICSKTHVFG